MAFKLTYKPYGERAILIEWPQVIDTAILIDILDFKDKIRISSIKSIIELKSTYSSLLIIYNEYVINFKDEIASIDKIYSSNKIVVKNKAVLWYIPVCYEAVFGLDLELISKDNNLTTRDIIEHHSNAIYTVYFIGFLPGFLYLGGLDESLNIPRKATPRLHVKKGSVAIGGNQTGVYPNESPGGWNIIGNTPINFFDISKEQPCFANPGDQIKFYPINLKAYQDIKTLVEASVYQLESEVNHD